LRAKYKKRKREIKRNLKEKGRKRKNKGLNEVKKAK
jgi:hypothetical protein